MAKHNYARPEMASSGGRDIWNLTSKPGSLVLQPDWRVLLVRQEGSAHIDQDRGWKCKCRSRLPIELNLSDAKMAHHSLLSPVQSTGADKGNSLIVNIFFLIYSWVLGTLTKATNRVRIGLSLQLDVGLLWLSFLMVTQTIALNSHRLKGALPACHNGGAV